MFIYLLIILFAAIWGIATYNTLISMRNKVKEGLSTIDVFMKKRFDLIPNLVSAVKGYAMHEANVLQQVASKRQSAQTLPQKMDADREMGHAMHNLFVQLEAYPELKADQNFLSLQDQLKTIEDEIANSRRYYNGCVRIYNTRIEQFPGNLIAKNYHFEPAELYMVGDASERETVNVDF